MVESTATYKVGVTGMASGNFASGELDEGWVEGVG